MSDRSFKYVIAGAGLAGCSAIEGIREKDKDGPILLIGRENHIPYHRPPLSKKLWTGKKKPNEIYVHDEKFFTRSNVMPKLGVSVEKIDTEGKKVKDSLGSEYSYEKLLLAMGGSPKKLDIPGGDEEGIFYYRYLDDYFRLNDKIKEGIKVLVIGGGYIGSEMAAVLCEKGADVTMIFPEKRMLQRIFPKDLAESIKTEYENKGVEIISEDVPAKIKGKDGDYTIDTKKGKRIGTNVIIAGIGIQPETGIAENAGIRICNGIEVDKELKTSDPDIYAAGDLACFPYEVIEKTMRLEHWDNAMHQGRAAGRNMAGARDKYTYVPYFFSDLFDFGFEALGEVNTELKIKADWKEDLKKGIVYYLDEGVIKGIMFCNVWEKVPEGRCVLAEKTSYRENMIKM